MSGTQQNGTGPASYVQRAINVTVSLGKGTFGQSGANTVKLSGLRVLCTIHKAGMPSFDSAEVRIFGMTQTLMQQLTVTGVPTLAGRLQNTILIEAGDAINGMSPVFYGDIFNAWLAGADQPEVYFQVLAFTGREQKLQPAPATSVRNHTEVATVMQALASQMGLGFENGGVNVQLASTYLPGSALDQAHSLARAANIELYVDSGTNPPTLCIWPRDRTRPGKSVLISPQSGLVGYPTFQAQYMSFRTLFNPGIKLGGQVTMQSSIQAACGTWYVVGPFNLNLAAQFPGGPWFCDCTTAPTLAAPPS